MLNLQAVVACGSTFVHHNATLFPDPHTFDPERWIGRPELENWLVPFSKGPRMCLGVKCVFPIFIPE